MERKRKRAVVINAGINNKTELGGEGDCCVELGFECTGAVSRLFVYT